MKWKQQQKQQRLCPPEGTSATVFICCTGGACGHMAQEAMPQAN